MKLFDQYKRIVIKIGSSIIIDSSNNKVNKRWMNSISKDIDILRKKDKEITIVSSGSIALGKKFISKNGNFLKLEDKQASAAIGQIELINNWQQSLKKFDIKSAQILLTLNDSESRKRYINAQKTLRSLLNKKFIPIVNENDTVATEEIRFGDNDRLAARVAQMTNADLLLILTETEGIYEKNPKKNPNAKKIDIIKSIDDKIESYADKTLSKFGSGGMQTKLLAAKICVSSGCSMIIASGIKNNPIQKINLNNSSWFINNKNKKSAKKQWIINHLNIMGEIRIDNGATKAIRNNKSLLPAGIIKIKGKFDIGDAVSIYNNNNVKIAVGLSAYNHNDIIKIIGKKSKEIKSILGFLKNEEFIHKDDLVLA